MISLAGVTLFFLGNKIDRDTGKFILSDGVRQEYEISKDLGNYLIPVGATGYMSKELWEEQIREINSGSTIYEDYKDLLNDLGDSSLSLKDLQNKIISLLKKITE